MKRNIFRTTFLLLIMVSFILITTVNATSVIGELKNNINTGSNTVNTVFNTANTVLGVIEVAGTGIAIVMLLYLAIKYMMAAPDGKAEYKKTAIMYVIGAVVLFAAPKLVKLVMNLSQNVTGTLN